MKVYVGGGHERNYFSRRFRNQIIPIDESDFQADYAGV